MGNYQKFNDTFVRLLSWPSPAPRSEAPLSEICVPLIKILDGDFQFRLSLDQPILVSLEDEARWAIRNKLTDVTKVPNYLDYIYTDALKAVKPGAVTIAGK